ncbi:hypothetical protein GCM10010862_07510 [Devosia nitrariae]|uniref:Uncharacterized protein n=1 Tax=Devosia nitrariae TaxID=2071872 RepID=A0ABQ5W0A1_9HYPH|nr:hypothetical protein GCM10010862_07510 [Devosia nitrariae]
MHARLTADLGLGTLAHRLALLHFRPFDRYAWRWRMKVSDRPAIRSTTRLRIWRGDLFAL